MTAADWYDAFAKSLASHASATGSGLDLPVAFHAGQPSFNRPVGQEWFRSPEVSEWLPRVGQALLHRAAVAAMHHWEEELDWAMKKLCQSPLEVVMLCSLLMAGVDRYDASTLRIGVEDDRRTIHVPNCSGEAMSVLPQFGVGIYHADFLVRIDAVSSAFIGECQVEVTKRAEIIVECDGHDYHDRTKEQASRDRERDREIQSLGYKVFRYTGADLWRDVFAAAGGVLDELEREIEALPWTPR